MHNTPSDEGRFEKSDMHLKLVLVTGVLVAILAVGTFALCYAMIIGFHQRPPATKFVKSPLAGEHQDWVTDVRLQHNMRRDLQALRSAQQHALETYGVVSEDPKIYRIPIETALDIVAQRGFPKFQPMDAALGIQDPSAPAGQP